MTSTHHSILGNQEVNGDIGIGHRRFCSFFALTTQILRLSKIDPYIWVNYNDLTVTSLGMMVSRVTIPK